MSEFAKCIVPALILVCTAPAVARPEFCEEGDAGALPFAAQVVGGAGTVTSINGKLGGIPLAGADFEDMYLISITDAEVFEARTVIPTDPTAEVFDTQLWLFEANPMAPNDGLGRLANNDAMPGIPGRFEGSSLLLPMSTDGTGVLLTPGLYYLAISGVGNEPLSFIPPDPLPIFQFGADPFEISGPDGLGGMQPITEWSGEGATGDYRIELQGVTFLPCGEIECPAGALPESEACGESSNDGCNSAKPAFEPINCGDTICGTAPGGKIGAGSRDTDWFEIQITETTRFTTTVVSQFPHGQGLIEYEKGTIGSGDCADVTGFVNPVVLGGPCENTTLDLPCLPAGTYFLFVSAADFEENLCIHGTVDYTLTLDCTPCSCIADLDDSGEVGFTDLLQVLSAWGPCSACPEDLDEDGVVGFVDLLIVLSSWGPCP